ncbi:MAG: hypothetical protein SOZ34_11420 [Clostridia bacterium]|nr:hypothetical protein [Clostridia bacterium]
MTKKILASALAGLMVLSSASALACDKDSFISYDIADAQGRYGKIYYCPEVGKNIINGYASTVEWVHAFYEAEYPHKEVQTLVLDGKKTGLTRYSGNYANAAVELRPDFWEAKAPYDIYHRLYSSLEGGAYKPSDVVGYAGLQEDIKVSFPVVGFDRFVVVDGKVMNYYNVYSALAGQVVDAPVGYTELDSLIDAYYNAVTDKDGKFTDAFLAGEEADWKYDMFNNAIPQYAWETLEGPNYYTGATQTIVPMKVLGDKLDEMSKKSNATGYHPEYYDDVIAKKTRNSQDVKWVTVGYEKEYPYRIYQVLCVNGVLLNGAAVETPAEGQKKVGEEVVAKYDMNVLDGVDNVYTSKTVDYDYRPSENDYDLTKGSLTDYTNALYYDRFNIFSNNKSVTEAVDAVPGMSFSTVTGGYEDTITMTKDVLVDKTTNLPYVFRYTGGVAHPKVEWKVAWPEAEYPYTIYEEKYLDGRATGIYRSTETSAEAIPSVTEANPKVGNGIRVLKVTLSGDNIQDSCLHDALIAKGYKFIVNGQKESFWRIPEILYPGHDFAGSGAFYFGPNNEYVAQTVETGFEEAQKALLSK